MAFGLAGVIHRYQPTSEIISRSRQLSEERWRDRRSLLTDEVRRLPEEFRGVFSPQTVDRLAREMLDSLDGSPVQNYLSALVYRGTRDRLQQLAGHVRPLQDWPLRLLFVCITGAGRSVLSAALAQKLGEGQIEARAVGASPVDHFDQNVLRVAAELGAAPADQTPLPLTDAEVEAADVVVTLGCGDVCPLYPGKMYRDWTVESPDDLPIEQVRRIAADLEALVPQLLDQTRASGAPLAVAS